MLRFSFLIHSPKFFERFMRTEILYLSYFLVLSRYFLAQILHSYIFTKNFWKIYENKNIVFKTISLKLSNILKIIFIIFFFFFFLLIYKKMVNTHYKKKQRTAPIRSTGKVPKSFWRRKRKKTKISLRQI